MFVSLWAGQKIIYAPTWASPVEALREHKSCSANSITASLVSLAQESAEIISKATIISINFTQNILLRHKRWIQPTQSLFIRINFDEIFSLTSVQKIPRL